MGPLPILTPSLAGDRKLSYTVELRLQTTTFIPGIRLLLNTTGETGGYLESATVRGRDMRDHLVERNADFSMQIPTEQLNDFIVVVENNYNILYLQQTMEEHTIEYRQAGAGLDYLRELERQMLDGLDGEEIEAQERRTAEWELFEVREMIRDFMEQQAAIEHAAIYSTVTVILTEVILPEVVVEEEVVEEIIEVIELTFSERLGNRISSSINILIDAAQGLLLVVIAIFPILLIIAFFAAITLLIIFAARRLILKFRKPVAKSIEEEKEE